MLKGRISFTLSLFAGVLMALPAHGLKTNPTGFVEVDEIRLKGITDLSFARANGDYYINGDSLGQMCVGYRVPCWNNDGRLPGDTTSEDLVSSPGDSAYAGTKMTKMIYDLSTHEADSTRAIDYAGFGFYNATADYRDISTATSMVLAYRLPNQQHYLTVGIELADNTTPTTITGFNTVVDSGGSASWKVKTIPIGSFTNPAGPISSYLTHCKMNQIDFAVVWRDSSATGIARGTANSSRTTGLNNQSFTSNGHATIDYYSLEGKLLASFSAPVNAGESFRAAEQKTGHVVAGACLARVRGCGVDVNCELIR